MINRMNAKKSKKGIIEPDVQSLSDIVEEWISIADANSIKEDVEAWVDYPKHKLIEIENL